MQSLTELYKAGRGPSSSHTMGPDRAARHFLATHPEADAFAVTLFGSLAKTGKGHGTDRVLHEAFAPKPLTLTMDLLTEDLPHPNTMQLTAFKDGIALDTTRVMSVGGGTIVVEGAPAATPKDIYPHTTFSEIAEYCRAHDLRLWEYVAEVEGPGIWDYLYDIWETMQKSIDEGLETTGILPGGLLVERRAHALYYGRHMDETPATRENRLICSYAFAVGEQNAGGGTVVTAPTCGACGVLPALLRYNVETRRVTDSQVLRAL
ncbi:MAG: L-serine ammonia-lyase, iron-sulfur-dependent, subunit alpha, partial [Clostridia bacterium]|nr:L-serine ammonia-lyase, iron-sulfur-dependent, subunit alpha [Clostridia bacterium]